MMTTMFPVQKAGIEFLLRCFAAWKVQLPTPKVPPVQKRRFEAGGPCRGIRVKA